MRGCSSRDLLDQIGRKWAVLVLGELGKHPLAAAAGRIEREDAHQTLRTLERDGLVRRTVYPEVPPHVEYDLPPSARPCGGRCAYSPSGRWSMTAQSSPHVRSTTSAPRAPPEPRALRPHPHRASRRHHQLPAGVPGEYTTWNAPT
ncbi:winged helix-turn-helix transcriptional regulator [Streptomyces longwoodensis]|uniref:winged helix-turn-helix transcriptional regulator n=1 Tax=Streptomyces longwoodensis TaxID=68231 RepID=UPI0034099C92